MRTYRQKRQDEEKPNPRAAFLGLIYFLIVVAAAYGLSALAMEQVNFYRLMGLSRRQVPEWGIQLALVLVIGFALQLVITIVLGLLSGDDKDENFTPPYQNPWEN